MCRLRLKNNFEEWDIFSFELLHIFFKDLLKIATSRLKLENSANGEAEFLDQTVLSVYDRS